MSYIQEDLMLRLRCAYYAYQEEARERFLDEDERTAQAIDALQPTIADYNDRKINFATVKYRMDNMFTQSDSAFPPRIIIQTLSDLALGLKVDDMERAMHHALLLPDDLEKGKGQMLDLEIFFEEQIALKRLRKEHMVRIPRLMACFWHIQDPIAWPPMLDSIRSFLIKNHAFEPLDIIQDYSDYAGATVEIGDAINIDYYELEHVCSLLLKNELEVPSEEVCFNNSMAKAKMLDEIGKVEEAIDAYEHALALRPETTDALLRAGELYASRGQLMLAIAEIESLVELRPKSLSAHKKLLTLYHDAKRVKEFNEEVLRFQDLVQSE
jgi:tetratricopeptide (TPR) repeat protein